MNTLILQSKATVSNTVCCKNEIAYVLETTGTTASSLAFTAVRLTTTQDATLKIRTVINGVETIVTQGMSANTQKQIGIDMSSLAGVGKGKRLYYFFSFTNADLSILKSVMFVGSNTNEKISFRYPLANLFNAKNLEEILFDGQMDIINNSGELFDLYNLDKFTQLKKFYLKTVYAVGEIYFGDFCYNGTVEEINIAKTKGVNMGFVYSRMKHLKKIEIGAIYDVGDNDLSLLCDSDIEDLTIESSTSLTNNGTWKGGRALSFSAKLKNIYIADKGMASNADKVDMLICLANSSFTSEATVTFVSLTIDSSDTELTDAIATLATKCTLTINGQVVS